MDLSLIGCFLNGTQSHRILRYSTSIECSVTPIVDPSWFTIATDLLIFSPSTAHSAERPDLLLRCRLPDPEKERGETLSDGQSGRDHPGVGRDLR